MSLVNAPPVAGCGAVAVENGLPCWKFIVVAEEPGAVGCGATGAGAGGAGIGAGSVGVGAKGLTDSNAESGGGDVGGAVV